MLPLVLFLIPLSASGAEPTYQDRLRSIESQVRNSTEDAKRSRSAWRDSLFQDPTDQRPGYAICRFEYSKAIELEMLIPSGKSLEGMGVDIRERSRKMVEFVFPTARPAALDPQALTWTLRVRERGGEAVRDLVIQPDGPQGPGLMRVGDKSLRFDNSMLVSEDDEKKIDFPFFSRRRLSITCRCPAPR